MERKKRKKVTYDCSHPEDPQPPAGSVNVAKQPCMKSCMQAVMWQNDIYEVRLQNLVNVIRRMKTCIVMISSPNR